MLLSLYKSSNKLLDHINSYIQNSITGNTCDICSKLKIYIEEQFIIEDVIYLVGENFHLLIKPDIVIVYNNTVEVIDIKSGSVHSDYLEQLIFYVYGLSKIFRASHYICSIYSIKDNNLSHLLYYNNVKDIENDFYKLIDILEKYLKDSLKVSSIRDLTNKHILDDIVSRNAHNQNKCFICSLKCICPYHGNKDEYDKITTLIQMTTRDIIVISKDESFVLSTQKD